MRKTKRKLFRRISVLFFLIVFISAIVFIIFEKSLAGQLEIYARQASTNKIGSALHITVVSELEKSGITYDKIIKIDKTPDGKITSVHADMMNVNLVKNRLDVAVSEFCEKEKYYEVKIPIGNLWGSTFFYGKGFDIAIKFRPCGSAKTSMTGNFYEAGINQTMYRISFDVEADIAIVFPFNYMELPVECETIIAETIIVGDVPDSFTHFDLQGDITSQDFQGYVEDYMAE